MIVGQTYPSNRTEYYARYVEYILRREYKDKEDYRVEDLMLGLHAFAKSRESAVDGFSSVQIIESFSDCFKKNGEKDSGYAKDLYKLACAIPLIEKKDENYGFVKYAYFDYFKGEIRIENVIG